VCVVESVAVRTGALEQRGGTLESLHSPSVAEPTIGAYIV
jgi:hypothetical protein